MCQLGVRDRRKHYIGLNLTFDIFVSKIQKEAHDSSLKIFVLGVVTNVLVNIVIGMIIVDQLGSKLKTDKE